MSKSKKRIKNYFNLWFKEVDGELQIRNYKLFDASLKAFLFYLLILLPVFAYSYIIFANSNLSFYINYTSSNNEKIWQLLNVGNGNLIMGFWITGVIFLVFSLLGFLLFKPIITSNKFPKSKRYLYIIFLAIIALLTILFFGLSQYEYSRFFEYYRYSLLFSNYQEIKLSWAAPVTKYFIDNTVNLSDGDFGWATGTMTLWMMFVQMMLAFVTFLVLQNAVFVRFVDVDDKEEKYILLSNPKRSFDQTGSVINNKFLKSIINFFKNDQRNLTVYIIVGSFLVLISNFVYSIIITSPNTNIFSLIYWSLKISYLFSDLQGFVDENGVDGYQRAFDLSKNGYYYGSYFTISSLQIIFLGLTISMLFFFIIVFFRQKKVSYKIFTVQTAILFVLLICTITTTLFSKVLVYRLQNLWTEQHHNRNFLEILNQAIKANDENQNQMILFQAFNPNQIFDELGFKIEWLNENSNIADGIITYAFIFGLFTIVTVNNNHLKVVGKKIWNDFNKLKNRERRKNNHVKR